MFLKFAEQLVHRFPLSKQLDVAIPTMDAAMPTVEERTGDLLLRLVPVCVGVILVLILVFVLVRVFSGGKRGRNAPPPAPRQEEEDQRKD